MDPHEHIAYEAVPKDNHWIVKHVHTKGSLTIPIQFPDLLSAQHFAKALTLGRRFSEAESRMGEVVGKVQDGLRP
jgi:hypothetical protein